MVEISPINSQKSSPDLQGRRSRQDSIGSTVSGESSFSLQKTRESRESAATATALLPNQQTPIQNVYSAEKPPIPPRGVFPPNQRPISTENTGRERSGKYIQIFH